jgi:hypothetical protein
MWPGPQPMLFHWISIHVGSSHMINHNKSIVARFWSVMVSWFKKKILNDHEAWSTWCHVLGIHVNFTSILHSFRACSHVINIPPPNNVTMLGLAWKLDPRVRPNHYWTIGGACKALLGWNSWGLLGPNFQLLYKKIKYQYLTMFDQIKS